MGILYHNIGTQLGVQTTKFYVDGTNNKHDDIKFITRFQHGTGTMRWGSWN